MLEGFPEEIIELMLIKQVQAGNTKDITVFENNIGSDNICGGFNWDDTTEGEDFWKDVLVDKDFDLFFKLYPKENNSKIITHINCPEITKDAIYNDFNYKPLNIKLKKTWQNHTFLI